MLRTITLRVLVTTGLALPFLGGCGDSAPDRVPAPPTTTGGGAPAGAAKTSADPDDQPITEADVARPKGYADAVARLKGYNESIRGDVAAGRPTKAHRALDELDIVLNWLPGIARDSGVPKEHWEEVNTNAQRLQELFNKVHGQIDAKQKPDYNAIAADVDKVFERLEAAAGPSTEPKGEAGPSAKNEPGE
jgi:hypothetical protein